MNAINNSHIVFINLFIRSPYRPEPNWNEKRRALKPQPTTKMTSISKRHIALMLVIMCVVCTIESTRDRNPSNRRRDRPVSPTTTGLCEKGVDMKLLCHCNHDHYKQKVNEVDCFLLHEEFPQSDPSWLAFNSHTNIKHIQLTVTQHGYLGYLPIDVFRRQRDLQTLNIQYGNIREIPSYAFSNLTRVHNITMEHNQIEILNAFAFANHPALVELNLQLNQITSINRMAFINLPKLEELMLSHNNLSTLPNDVFSNITNLNKLRLNDNLLIALTRDVFKGLGKLLQLDLSVNNLKSLGEGLFAELWSLQELYLENNSLEVSNFHFCGTGWMVTWNVSVQSFNIRSTREEICSTFIRTN